MYLPPQFESRDRAVAVRLMREYPFASLITVDDDGLPFVSHLPLHVHDEESSAPGDLRLLGHMARPNPQWRHLQARPRAVVSFLGPHAYLSPRAYPDLARVPSWNYVALDATVAARLLPHDDVVGKDALLKQLIADHEPAYAEQWRGLDEALAHKLLQGIVAFELRLEQWQCKLKLNQHRPESHQALHAAYAAGNAQEQDLARWMRDAGLRGLADTTEE